MGRTGEAMDETGTAAVKGGGIAVGRTEGQWQWSDGGSGGRERHDGSGGVAAVAVVMQWWMGCSGRGKGHECYKWEGGEADGEGAMVRGGKKGGVAEEVEGWLEVRGRRAVEGWKERCDGGMCGRGTQEKDGRVACCRGRWEDGNRRWP